uniref:Uncharacterized protein n=1 Tax=Megaselia scalaris TaxID=36166 RepID=T1GG05_MEGSC
MIRSKRLRCTGQTRSDYYDLSSGSAKPKLDYTISLYNLSVLLYDSESRTFCFRHTKEGCCG